MNIVNKPRIPRAIASIYAVILVLTLALTALFIGLTIFTPTNAIAGVIASVVLVFVSLVIILIIVSIYRTSYVVKDDELTINATRLIGGPKTIPLNNITSIEKTVIPFGFRLFGASFYGGYCYIPSVGRAFIVITNFEDGLWIKTEHGNYIITPGNPMDFKETIESRIKDRTWLAATDRRVQ